ncbi:MAG: DUF4388 domain-containing protein [Acidobacteriota bacterium]|nr:DUF4388 domain-containing protein [Acidobacteriota bacterium]
MSFRGELGQFGFFDVLQMIATTGKSGRLQLSREDGRGLVVFRDGKIVFAASDSLREALGSLLLSQGLLEPAQLKEALAAQKDQPIVNRLGNILVERGWVSQQDLEEAVTSQVERVIADLGAWRRGFFDFTPVTVPARGDIVGDIEVDARDLILEQGLSADHVLLSIAVQLDEAELDHAAKEEETHLSARQLFELRQNFQPSTTGLAAESTAEIPESLGSAETRIAAIKTLMSEINSPKLTGEVTSSILDNAQRSLRRTALFAIHTGAFIGVAQRGIEALADRAILGLKIPVRAPSILRRCAERREPVRGSIADQEGDAILIEAFGGVRPVEAVTIPLVVEETVRLVVYGDNLPEQEPVGAVHDLELLLLQAALAMERALLKERVKQLEFYEVLHGRG